MGHVIYYKLFIQSNF